jgi:hypothetical protein
MGKPETHFPQVPVEIAKKVAEAESHGHSDGHASEPLNGSLSAAKEEEM